MVSMERGKITTIGLIIVILVLILFNITIFITGPTNIYAKEDNLIVTEIIEKNSLEEAVLLFRFSNKEIYYILTIEDGTKIIWCLEDGSIVDSRISSSFLPENVLEKVQENEGFSNPVIQLGYYQNQPIYVISDKYQEVWIDYDTYEVVLRYRKGLGS